MLSTSLWDISQWSSLEKGMIGVVAFNPNGCYFLLPIYNEDGADIQCCPLANLKRIRSISSSSEEPELSKHASFGTSLSIPIEGLYKMPISSDHKDTLSYDRWNKFLKALADICSLSDIQKLHAYIASVVESHRLERVAWIIEKFKEKISASLSQSTRSQRFAKSLALESIQKQVSKRKYTSHLKYSLRQLEKKAKLASFTGNHLEEENNLTVDSDHKSSLDNPKESDSVVELSETSLSNLEEEKKLKDESGDLKNKYWQTRKKMNNYLAERDCQKIKADYLENMNKLLIEKNKELKDEIKMLNQQNSELENNLTASRNVSIIHAGELQLISQYVTSLESMITRLWPVSRQTTIPSSFVTPFSSQQSSAKKLFRTIDDFQKALDTLPPIDE